MPVVDLGGCRMFYEEQGSGVPLLLIHGGLGTANLHWWKELPILAARFRVIAPDLRGYGQSDPPREFPLDFYQRDAADMESLLRAVAAVPSHVVGWSDGAVVAVVLAVHHPEVVRTLTVVSGEARLVEAERAAWPGLVDTSTWSDGALRRFAEAQGPKNYPAIFQRMIAGYNRLLDERGGEIVSDRVHEIRCPTLILHGDQDPTVPVEHAHALHAAIPGSTLHVYPDTGHLPHREHEADFRKRLLVFLQGQTVG